MNADTLLLLEAIIGISCLVIGICCTFWAILEAFSEVLDEKDKKNGK